MARITTKIDMHTHTRGSDGWGDPADIVRYAKRAKLDGVCLTDHHRTYTAEGLEVARALRAAGLLAFHGCEFSTALGHLLVYGVNVEEFDWGYYPDPSQIVTDVKASGGLCVVPHPYKGYARRFGDQVLSLKGLAGIETANGQCTFQDPQYNRQAAALAERRKWGTFGGSDSHNPRHIGLCYTQFNGIIRTETELLRAMKIQKNYRAITSKKLVQRELGLIKRNETQDRLSYDLLPGRDLDSPLDMRQSFKDGSARDFGAVSANNRISYWR